MMVEKLVNVKPTMTTIKPGGMYFAISNNRSTLPWSTRHQISSHDPSGETEGRCHVVQESKSHQKQVSHRIKGFEE
jgi:hypothetical protein